MKRAKKYIHVQYYIIRNDEVWQDIEKVLIEKAHEGVEVRVLFDSMGCRTMHKKRLGQAEMRRNSGRRILPGDSGTASDACELSKSQKDCRD